MIYIGYHGTMTPAHKVKTRKILSLLVATCIDNCLCHQDIMGTLGHNIMVWSDPGACALWFLVSTHDRDLVREFWEKHNASIDEDNYFMPVEVSLAGLTLYIEVSASKIKEFVGISQGPF